MFIQPPHHHHLIPREEFIEYKYSVPVFGAILLDSTCEQVRGT